MGIKRKIAKVARERLYSKDGVRRYRSEEEELEELRKEAKKKKKPKRRGYKMKLMDIPPTKGRKKSRMSDDIKRMERKNRGK